MYFFEPPRNDDYRGWVKLAGVLTPAECQSVLCLASRFSPAQIVRSDDGVVDREHRRCESAIVEWSDNNNWLFDRIAGAVLEANDTHFRFDLNGFVEEFAVLRYHENDQHDWHTDHGEGVGVWRKLTVVASLSDPATFEGGRIRLHEAEDPDHEVSCEMGSMLIFPSFIPHRVTPLTRGIRHVLVGWVYGPPFR